jgi:hypothetical protein
MPLSHCQAAAGHHTKWYLQQAEHEKIIDNKSAYHASLNIVDDESEYVLPVDEETGYLQPLDTELRHLQRVVDEKMLNRNPGYFQPIPKQPDHVEPGATSEETVDVECGYLQPIDMSDYLQPVATDPSDSCSCFTPSARVGSG